MARQLRLVIPGLPHLVCLAALPGLDPFPAAADRVRFLAMLRDAAADAQPQMQMQMQMQVHAYALLPGEARILATPAGAQALSRCIQAVGRRYVSTYNRMQGRSGTIWSGRFRCAAIEPGSWALLALRYVDGASPEPMLTSAHHRSGGPREPWLTDPQAYWSLGNTPFERESAYARLLTEPLGGAQLAMIDRCLRGGWPCGAEGFARGLQVRVDRRVAPRPRGRPAHAAARDDVSPI